MEWYERTIFKVIAAIFAVCFVALLVWRAAWVTFIDNHEFGFIYDKFDGTIEKMEHTGWIVRNPFAYAVHAIDMRPYQVSISANERILNAKLVRFNPVGLETFIEWHGRDAGDRLDNLKEILKCYAFDRDEGRDCPFLTVSSVLAPSQSAYQDSLGGRTK